VALRTPTQNAEIIKRQHATVLPGSVDPQEMIEVPSVAKRPPKQVQRRALAQVVQARYEELFALVLAEIRRSGFEDLISAGIVITGGASKIQGGMELAETIFQVPVRLGLPQNVEGLVDVRQDPSFSTGVGLLLYGLQQQGTSYRFSPMKNTASVWERMKSWFQGNF
jgi:cell division protein FtsA